jgi:hypothetical protein
LAIAKPKTRSSTKPAPVAPVSPPAAEPSAPQAKPQVAKLSNEESDDPTPVLLKRAQALYDSLEYDKVIPVTEELLSREDLRLEEKLEAHRLNGCAKAIVQDPVDSEKPFRLLLRTRPNYDLPPDTAPKILAVFRKVQIEEKALAEQADAFVRDGIKKSMKVLDELPATGKGGRALPFALRLKDPGAVVESVKVPYRRAGQGEFSVLALHRDDDGRWRGQIPAEFTAGPEAFTLEYYVETADAKGPLLVQGNAKEPLHIDVSAGKLQGAPPPLHRGVFFSTLALAIAAGLTYGTLGLLELHDQATYAALSGPQSGTSVVALAQQGRNLATATTVAGLSFAGVAVLALVFSFFTDWEPAPK